MHAQRRLRRCQLLAPQLARLEPIQLRLRLAAVSAEAHSRRLVRLLTRSRPQLAFSALEKHVVQRKGQSRRIAAVAVPSERGHAQCVVEIGWVHPHIVLRHARPQPCQPNTTSAAPRLHERAVARAVLQTHGMQSLVQRIRLCQACTVAGPRQSVVEEVPRRERTVTNRARAVRHCARESAIRRHLAAAHLESSVGHTALDMQPSGLRGKRMQEKDVTKSRVLGRRGEKVARSTRQLQVARARKDDAA